MGCCIKRRAIDYSCDGLLYDNTTENKVTGRNEVENDSKWNFGKRLSVLWRLHEVICCTASLEHSDWSTLMIMLVLWLQLPYKFWSAANCQLWELRLANLPENQQQPKIPPHKCRVPKPPWFPDNSQSTCGLLAFAAEFVVLDIPFGVLLYCFPGRLW